MTLVLDSSFVVRSCLRPDGFDPLGRQELVAPPLMWSECVSAIHEALWRREISIDHAEDMRDRLFNSPVKLRNPRKLLREAWGVSDQLGWAKVYDAEYVALARLLGCRLVTADLRLRRGAERLGFVITPQEL